MKTRTPPHTPLPYVSVSTAVRRLPPRMVRISFDIPDDMAPALRSWVEEARNEIGERCAGTFRYGKEGAITRAAACAGIVAAAVNAKVPAGDPEYE